MYKSVIQSFVVLCLLVWAIIFGTNLFTPVQSLSVQSSNYYKGYQISYEFYDSEPFYPGDTIKVEITFENESDEWFWEDIIVTNMLDDWITIIDYPSNTEFLDEDIVLRWIESWDEDYILLELEIDEDSNPGSYFQEIEVYELDIDDI